MEITKPSRKHIGHSIAIILPYTHAMTLQLAREANFLTARAGRQLFFSFRKALTHLRWRLIRFIPGSRGRRSRPFPGFRPQRRGHCLHRPDHAAGPWSLRLGGLRVPPPNFTIGPVYS